MRRSKLLIVCFFLSVIYSGCYYKYYFGKRPCDQPEGAGAGYMEINGEKISVYVGIGPGKEMDLFSEQAIESQDIYPEWQYEHWIGDFKKPDEFTATVKETTYFEVGQQIKFYRTKEGIPKTSET